jgi:hypothetical protein
VAAMHHWTNRIMQLVPFGNAQQDILQLSTGFCKVEGNPQGATAVRCAV